MASITGLSQVFLGELKSGLINAKKIDGDLQNVGISFISDVATEIKDNGYTRALSVFVVGLALYNLYDEGISGDSTKKTTQAQIAGEMTTVVQATALVISFPIWAMTPGRFLFLPL